MKILSFFKNTIVRVVSSILGVLFALSIFFFWGWFVIQFHHIQAYYYVFQADDFYKNGDFQNSIKNYNRALELYPEHTKAAYNLGNIYVSYEDYEQAAQSYEHALKYNPRYLNARINLGIVKAEKLLDYDGAIQEYTTAVETKPFIVSIPFIFSNSKVMKHNKAVAYYNLGLAYKLKALAEGDKTFSSYRSLSKAAENYEEAKKILPKNYDVRYNLALVLQLMGDTQKAGKEYCDAISLEPLNYEAHYNLAILLRHLKRYDEAVSELEKAGLILDVGGDGYNSQYVYGVLNEINSTLLNLRGHEYLVEHIDDKPSSAEYQYTYVHGKVVATDALDRAIYKNMKTCASYDFFNNY